MTINSNTQSFTSLNGAIKVRKLDDTTSSNSKKLDDVKRRVNLVISNIEIRQFYGKYKKIY